MLSEIPAALAAINTLKDLAKAVSSAKVDAALREQAIESNFAISDALNALITVQTQHQALLHEKDELEKRLVEIEDWKAEAEKYTLTSIAEGLFAYALKPDYKSTAPPHWLCSNCYEAKKKSVLQFEYWPPAHLNSFHCKHCDARLLDHSNNGMPK